MLNTLQAGRGLAAIAVLLFHLNIGAESLTGVDVIPLASDYGALGVDFFFVLSGFIMMLAHQNDIGRPERWKRFAYKRFARIYPVYWVYTLLVIAVLYAGVGSGERLSQSPADWFSTVSLVRITDVTTPIGPGWSLFHEILFYAVFSVLMLSRRAGLALMAVWFGACALLGVFPEGNVYSPYTTAISALNLDFLMGMAAFALSRRMRSIPTAIAVTLAGVLLLFIAAGLGNQGFAGSGYIFGAGFAALIAGATNLERRRPASLPLLTFLGNASYSIYLLHEIGLTVIGRALLQAGVANPYVLVGLTGSGALAVGLAGYLLVEKPLTGFMRRRREVGHGTTTANPESRLADSR